MAELAAPAKTTAVEWRTGWPLVAGATIGVAIAGMHYPIMGAMMLPLTQAHGWTRGEASLGLTIASLLLPLANVLVGAMADRLGPRPVVLGGSLLFGATYALFALTGPDLLSWYIVSAVFALCSTFAGPIVWTMAVVRHFSASRGLALALTLSGSGVMASVMPTIVLALLDWVGLRGTFLVLAGSASILMFVPAYFLFREPGKAGQSHAMRSAAEAGLPGLSVGQALAGTQFWRLAFALLVVSGTVGMFILHYQSMLADAGLSRAEAASAALMIGPAMIVGRLGTGLLFDRLPARLVAAGAFAVLALACGLMMGFEASLPAAFVVAGVIGLGVGAQVDVVAFLSSRYFGLRRYGLLFGVLMGIYGLGVGAGSAVAGWVFDNTGDYDAILIALGGGCVVAGLLALTLGKPSRLAEQKSTPDTSPSLPGSAALSPRRAGGVSRP